MDESTPMMEFEPRTLETTGRRRDRAPIDGRVTTAHPIGDGGTGELVNYVLHLGARTSYNVFAFVGDAGDVREIASIPVKEPSYMHSFAMTQEHVVLIQNPLVANPLSFLTSPRPFIEHYEWRPELGTRFTVVPRGGGPVTTKEAAPFFCYHHVNSFEMSGAIQCDVLTYPDATIVKALMLDNLRSDRPEDIRVGELRRYSIPTEEGREVTSRSISSVGLEFPRIDPRRILGEHRFIYGTGQTSKDGTDFLDQLVKVDVSDGTVKRWGSEGCYPGEAVFVPRPGGHQEDDGAVVSVVLDHGGKASFLLLLDGNSFKELARIAAPQLIPFKFHGNFYMS
jgi:carotenoid cleavage dioxygenase-like enzyme